MKRLFGKDEEPAHDYEKGRQYLAQELTALRDEAEIKWGKPTLIDLATAINEAESILKTEDDRGTAILRVKEIVAKLSPHNPHGGQLYGICNLPKFLSIAGHIVASWCAITETEIPYHKEWAAIPELREWDEWRSKKYWNLLG